MANFIFWTRIYENSKGETFRAKKIEGYGFEVFMLRTYRPSDSKFKHFMGGFKTLKAALQAIEDPQEWIEAAVKYGKTWEKDEEA